MKRVRYTLIDGLVATALTSIVILGLISSTGADETEPATFSTPKAAAEALVNAASQKDSSAIAAILGPGTKEWITSGDPVQDRQARERFVSAFDTKRAIEIEGNKAILLVGPDRFPFPFPIVKKKGGWTFDAEQGREELFSRRIGANELNTVQVLKAIADAEREYATEDRDGDGLGAYASRFRSTEGKHDGLYWSTGKNEKPSPLGSLIATASGEGYVATRKPEDSQATGAYHGYHFKLLKGQGPDAPGGAYSYMVGDKMFGGFAVVAWPAKYGVSGIMTFMISHIGKVYESNLGPETKSIVKNMDRFNPDKDWTEVDTEGDAPSD